MRFVLAAAGLGAVLGLAAPGPAHAQTQLDHDTQKVWDNLFDPGPPGDPRTNWERRQDQRHANAAAAYCYYHPGAPNCPPR